MTLEVKVSASQSTEKRYNIPRTLTEAASLIAKLGFSTPSLEEMQCIKNVCGFEPLAQALVETLNGEVNEESKRFLSGTLGVIAPSTRKRLEIMGMQIPDTSVLVRIGVTEGSEFVSLVREAANGSNESARGQVALTLARFQEDDAPCLANTYVGTTEQSELPSTTQTKPKEPVQKIHAVGSFAATPDGEPVCEEDNPEDVDDGKFLTAHVYGGGFALCFNAVKTKQGIPSINLDAGIEVPANQKQGGQKKRIYSWKDKITVQFTVRELHLVYAVMMGYMNEFQGSGHGAAHDKWFTLSKQKGRIFVSVHRRGAPSRGVPITAGDLCPVLSLLTLQLLAGAPHLTIEQLNLMAQRAAALANESENVGDKV